MIEIDKDVGQDHEDEDERWWLAFLEAFSYLLIHILIYRIDNIISIGEGLLEDILKGGK